MLDRRQANGNGRLRVSKLERTRSALEAIESRGYKVRGRHDDIESGPSPVSVTATDETTGKTYHIERKDGDEYQALVDLASQLGFELEL